MLPTPASQFWSRTVILHIGARGSNRVKGSGSNYLTVYLIHSEVGVM